MLKRINWKAILMGITWVTCLSGLVVLMSFVSEKKQTVKCSTIKILIPGADNFIEREEIDAILKQNFGNIIGQPIEGIQIHLIEKRIAANPYIAFVKVYVDMDGSLKISIKQREPVMRVINATGQDFYIDKDGLKMPISPNFTADVLVATGNILEPFSGKNEKISSIMLLDLYKIATFINSDSLWDAQIEQIYVNDASDIELVPRVGIQKIIIGNADNLDLKMKNLLLFYKKAMPKVGWDTYKTINVKYKGQIVCEKNIIDSTELKILTPAFIADTSAANSEKIEHSNLDIEESTTPTTPTNTTQVVKITTGKVTPEKKSTIPVKVEPAKKTTVTSVDKNAKPVKKNSNEKDISKTQQNN